MATVANRRAQPVTTPARRASGGQGEAQREVAPTTPAEPREPTGSHVPATTRPSGGAVAAQSRGIPISDDYPPTEYSLSHADEGMEGLRPEDLQQPRLKLIQGISSELDIYDDLRAGQFLHVQQEIIISEPLVVVPIAWDRR